MACGAPLRARSSIAESHHYRKSGILPYRETKPLPGVRYRRVPQPSLALRAVGLTRGAP